MIKTIFTLFLVCLSQAISAQTSDADQVLGIWVSEDKQSIIEMLKAGSEYSGRLLMAENLLEADGKTSRKDLQNRDPKLRDRPLQHITLLSDFVYEDGIWDNGKMYDPKSGKTYHCFLKIRGKLLEIRSYVGIPLFGRSTYWERQPHNL